MKFAIYTLGCKVNQYETQAMETELLRRGHTLTSFEEDADVYIVNTCTVTAVSDKKSRQVIRQAQKRNPSAVIAVCGCYAQTDPEKVKTLGVELLSGTGDHLAFLQQAEELAKAKKRQQTDLTDDALRRRLFERLPAGGLTRRTRAMLKVEDGCVNFCSYCMIPYARGPVRSMPLEEAVEQARCLDAEGYREVVLTGIELSSWGRDLDGSPELWRLIEEIALAAPRLRLRLGSLEPRTITPDFCRHVAPLPNLCDHFHLSLQSGCDATLRRMNRKYDTARFRESVALLRQFFDDPAITTDLIVGFPGEDEEEFRQTMDFLAEMRFSAMHIFPYSRRTGTPAAKMDGQLPRSVKEERAARAGQLASAMTQTYLESQVGKTLPVLFEEEREGLWLGHAPNYTQVAVHSERPLRNLVLPVTVTALSEGVLQAVLQE